MSIVNAGEGSYAARLWRRRSMLRHFCDSHDCTGPDGSADCLTLTAAASERRPDAPPTQHGAPIAALKCPRLKTAAHQKPIYAAVSITPTSRAAS